MMSVGRAMWGSYTTRGHRLREATGSCSNSVRHIREFLTRILAAIRSASWSTNLSRPSPPSRGDRYTDITPEHTGTPRDTRGVPRGGIVKLTRLEAITRYRSKRMAFHSLLTQRGPCR